MVLDTVLAHQGGWDELLLVAGPVMVFAGLLALARRRALSLGDDRQPTTPDDHHPTAPDDPRSTQPEADHPGWSVDDD